MLLFHQLLSENSHLSSQISPTNPGIVRLSVRSTNTRVTTSPHSQTLWVSRRSLSQYKKLGARIRRPEKSLRRTSSLRRSRSALTSAKTTTCYGSHDRWKLWLRKPVCKVPSHEIKRLISRLLFKQKHFFIIIIDTLLVFYTFPLTQFIEIDVQSPLPLLHKLPHRHLESCWRYSLHLQSWSRRFLPTTPLRRLGSPTKTRAQQSLSFNWLVEDFISLFKLN